MSQLSNGATRADIRLVVFRGCFGGMARQHLRTLSGTQSSGWDNRRAAQTRSSSANGLSVGTISPGRTASLPMQTRIEVRTLIARTLLGHRGSRRRGHPPFRRAFDLGDA